MRSAARGAVLDDHGHLTTRGWLAKVPLVPVRRIAWLVLLVARLSAAEPRVVLVETRDAPVLPTLASQVELQAGRRVTVRAVAARQRDPMTYADEASRLVAAGDATVVVWIASVDRGYLVFAAGGWPGRALIELVRVDADIGTAEIERTVALKIAALLDAVLAPRAGAAAVLGIARAEPGQRWAIEVAGAVAREPHERGYDGRAALGIRRGWTSGLWTIAPGLAAYWQPTGTIERDRGRASITELGAIAALDVARDAGRIQLFARPRFVVAALAAAGASSDGRRGEVTLVMPYVGLEAGARRAVSDAVSLGVAIGCDVALIHRELVIDDATLVDLGRARLHVGILLLLSL